MPKSTTMGLRCVLALVAALAVAAACCSPASAVVGGTTVANITDAPYQVAIVDRQKNAYPGQFCGGSITEDMRHIITAAHCVFDTSLSASGQPVSPDALMVIAGTRSLNGYSGGGDRRGVAAVSFDDDFDPATFSHDVAILTLDGSLPQGNPGIESISLVGPLEWNAAQQPGAEARVSGWGETRSNDPASYPRDLQMATLPLVSDPQCAPPYPGFDAPAMTCAGNAIVDSCFGDSGGPLVVDGVDAPAPRLLGIVSFGPSSGCAIPNSPGVYTEAYDSAIRTYLAQPPTSAPRTLVSPTVQGTVEVGSTVSCSPGTWEGSPSFSYQFVVPTANGDVARTAQGAQGSYTIQPADAGNALACNVKGTNAGGIALAESAAVTVPTPPGATPVAPNQSPSQSQQDTAAPVARITKTSCTATRCTLTVAVTDAGFSAGIKTVQASVRSSYRTRCKRKGHRKTVACTKHRTIKPSVAAVTATHFKVVASKLPYGTQVFTVLAVDKAGHRQALPTTKTVKTKKPRKRR
jgi:trypsin